MSCYAIWSVNGREMKTRLPELIENFYSYEETAYILKYRNQMRSIDHWHDVTIHKTIGRISCPLMLLGSKGHKKRTLTPKKRPRLLLLYIL